MKHDAIDLLCKMISLPSVSRNESRTADLLENFLKSQGLVPHRVFNNVFVTSADFYPERPTLLLNSHHDTVKPSPSYSFNPYEPIREEGKIYGLGSNDAGASVVSLIMAFLSLQSKPLDFNLLLAITAEEEVSGEKGMRAFLADINSKGILPAAAIVGEPTGLRTAIGERGLIVLDCEAKGIAGHAARDEGVNAIYKAMKDIARLSEFKFDKTSRLLGPIKISVTQIEAGSAHNVIPDRCRFVVDVRTTDAYSNEETARILGDVMESESAPRSTRVRASVIDHAHPLVKAALSTGSDTFISPTTSDMALMYDIPSVKIGPGDSARSHAADEFIYESEISEAIDKYISIISQLKL